MSHLWFWFILCYHRSPVGVLLVFDVQVLECGDEGLRLEPSGSAGGHRCVTYGSFCSNGGDVASQWRSESTRFVSGLSDAAHVEAAAEINAVQNLRGSHIMTQRPNTEEMDTFLHSPYG